VTERQEALVGHILGRLGALREDIVAQWRSPQGTRTRHFVVDDLLPDAVRNQIFAAFPRDGDGFFSRDSFREKKRTSADLGAYDPILTDITYAIQDIRVVRMIEELTGFDRIEPDPKLYAGGLSMMFKGDFLNPHIDNSHDGERRRYRRLNLLYYVSPDWNIANGGNLELWDDDIRNNVTLISAANRLVVMETNRHSWHSVSPIVSDVPRCCVSNYYFSAVSPDESDYFHVTSFTGRPEEASKRALGVADNAVRNLVARTLKLGRGKDLVNPER
jgi:Rps23 Pro-64 3,4-dihydroxylase Tpa1-like proline 4-hydroxylase